MRVLILKNTPAEGPGTIGDYLRDRGLPLDVVELGRGETLPPLEGYGAVVAMGGPMAVYEMGRFPYLEAEAALLRAAVDRGLRVLGVCLGAQVLAHALGGEVTKGTAGQEIGWMHVRLTAEGLVDPIMGALSNGRGPDVTVFQWHGDTFSLPPGARLLAGSGQYRNQAFRLGEYAYGLQFHIEVTAPMLEEWFADEPAYGKTVLADTPHHVETCARLARGFYERFFVED
jgi:GMP synthase-like glutamine amidotransferase